MNSSTLPSDTREALAAIEHERWSDWQKWCHQVLRSELDHECLPQLEKVLRRWERQIDTPYPALTDAEKASDMEQVDRYWPLIEAYIASQVAAEYKQLLKEMNNLKHTPRMDAPYMTPSGKRSEAEQLITAAQNTLLDQCRAIIEARIKELE